MKNSDMKRVREISLVFDILVLRHMPSIWNRIAGAAIIPELLARARN